jgi:rhamnose transport system substrate-binding protein
MKKLVTMFLIAVMMVTLFSGCSKKDEPTTTPAADTTTTDTPADTPAEAKTVKYAIIVKNTGNPYNEKEMEGFSAAVEELGGEVILKSTRPTNSRGSDSDD